MYISDLIKKDTKELNKISKTDLIKTITESKWQWDNNLASVKTAEEKLVKQSEEERSVKLMLIGYLGKEVERNEYDGSVQNIDRIKLTELIGELMVKAARY